MLNASSRKLCCLGVFGHFAAANTTAYTTEVWDTVQLNQECSFESVCNAYVIPVVRMVCPEGWQNLQHWPQLKGKTG